MASSRPDISGIAPHRHPSYPTLASQPRPIQRASAIVQPQIVRSEQSNPTRVVHANTLPLRHPSHDTPHSIAGNNPHRGILVSSDESSSITEMEETEPDDLDSTGRRDGLSEDDGHGRFNLQNVGSHDNGPNDNDSRGSKACEAVSADHGVSRPPFHPVPMLGKHIFKLYELNH